MPCRAVTDRHEQGLLALGFIGGASLASGPAAGRDQRDAVAELDPSLRSEISYDPDARLRSICSTEHTDRKLASRAERGLSRAVRVLKCVTSREYRD